MPQIKQFFGLDFYRRKKAHNTTYLQTSKLPLSKDCLESKIENKVRLIQEKLASKPYGPKSITPRKTNEIQELGLEVAALSKAFSQLDVRLEILPCPELESSILPTTEKMCEAKISDVRCDSKRQNMPALPKIEVDLSDIPTATQTLLVGFERLISERGNGEALRNIVTKSPKKIQKEIQKWFVAQVLNQSESATSLRKFYPSIYRQIYKPALAEFAKHKPKAASLVHYYSHLLRQALPNITHINAAYFILEVAPKKEGEGQKAFIDAVIYVLGAHCKQAPAISKQLSALLKQPTYKQYKPIFAKLETTSSHENLATKGDSRELHLSHKAYLNLSIVSREGFHEALIGGHVPAPILKEALAVGKIETQSPSKEEKLISELHEAYNLLFISSACELEDRISFLTHYSDFLESLRPTAFLAECQNCLKAVQETPESISSFFELTRSCSPKCISNLATALTKEFQTLPPRTQALWAQAMPELIKTQKDASQIELARSCIINFSCGKIQGHFGKWVKIVPPEILYKAFVNLESEAWAHFLEGFSELLAEGKLLNSIFTSSHKNSDLERTLMNLNAKYPAQFLLLIHHAPFILKPYARSKELNTAIQVSLQKSPELLSSIAKNKAWYLYA